MNDIAIALEKRFEQYRLGPYLCPAGIPTSGYGHAWKKGEIPKPLPPEEAEVELIKDNSIAESAVVRLSPRLLLENKQKQAAIIDFIFNLGSGAYQASTLRRKIKEGDWEAAQYQIQRWIFAGTRKLKGLILRRTAEALLLMK
jgi:lysozyme